MKLNIIISEDKKRKTTSVKIEEKSNSLKIIV